MHAADIRRGLARRLRSTFGQRFASTSFAGHRLTFDLSWRHERDYLDYIEKGALHGPLAMDVWVFARFVRPGDVTLDAGANIGFTALLAERAGAAEVHCFEPDPRLVERLSAHVGGGPIVVHPMALAEAAGRLQLCLSAEHNQGSTASPTIVSKFPAVFNGARYAEVEAVTIDGLFGNKHFDLMKVDVEGSELATLKGAAAMLRRDPPGVIYVEIYDELFPDLDCFLREHYRNVYRIACDSFGNGRLFAVGEDAARLAQAGLYVMPPSYIYSSEPREELCRAWTPPSAT